MDLFSLSIFLLRNYSQKFRKYFRNFDIFIKNGNPIQNIQQLLEYADIDNTILQYFDQFRESFLKVIPNTLASEVSKRKLIKSVKDLYSAKGTSEGHKVFMRLLLNETANIFYPNENMLRVSNGNWKQKIKIRCVSDGLGASSEILNQVITGKTSGATKK